MSIVTYQTYPQQTAFISDRRKWVAFIAGRNAGKTFAGSLKALLRVREGGLGVIAAPDFPQLQQGALKQFMARINECGERYYLVAKTNSIIFPDYGSEVVFSTMENDSRFRGPNYDWGWFDELDRLRDPSSQVWRATKGAIRAGPNPQGFATSTPKGRAIIYHDWVRHKTPAHRLYRATSFDNPFYGDQEQFVRDLGYTGIYYEQEINADFVSFEGLVYKAFREDRAKRVVDTIGWRKNLGVDFGTRNPLAIVTVALHDAFPPHIEREIYRGGLGATEMLDLICQEADVVDPDTIWCDPSAAEYLIDLQRRGYPARAAENDILYGVGVMDSAVTAGLTVDPACSNFIDEILAYHYPEKAQAIDKPVKEFDHLMDATRYVLASQPVYLTGPLMA